MAFRVELISPPERETLAASVMVDHEQLAEVNHELGNAMLEIYARRDGEPWILDFQATITALIEARSRVLRHPDVRHGDVDALWARALDTVNEIIQQRRQPADAARDLDRMHTELVRLSGALEPFVGQWAAWDYDPGRRHEVERTILSAAETFRRAYSRG